MEKQEKIFDTYIGAKRVWYSLSLIIRTVSLAQRLMNRVKIKKMNRIPKPPYLLLSTHASFMDFFVAIKATKPHHPYWVSTVEEFIGPGREFAFRHLGVLPKRKFTNDPRCAEILIDVLKRKRKILVIYPEARYSFIGKEERIDEGLGKLAKISDVPIVVLNCHGHFLRNPQWGDKKPRKISRLYSEMRTVVTKRQVRAYSPEEIEQAVKDAFKYDDEQFQLDNDIKITYPNRAVGMERVLYQCPHCGKEFAMSSEGSNIKCDACGVEYHLEENGTLTCLNAEAKFTRPSEWYYWEKENVKQEVLSGKYHFEDDVRMERLMKSSQGMVPMKGNYHLVHDNNGIVVTGDNGFRYERSALQSYAIHIEYNYIKRGACIDLATNTETYFAYPINNPKIVTKIHFAVEHIFDMSKSNIHKEENK